MLLTFEATERIISSIKRRVVAMDGMSRRKKAKVITEKCVACGCCAKVCPMLAIKVINGIFAQVDKAKCVGCGKCVAECPASIIILSEAENEK